MTGSPKKRKEIGRHAPVEGRAHEHVAVALLMKKYENVSMVDLPLLPYDTIIVRKQEDGSEDIIRAQIKTATKSVKFKGGSRGGIDRIYKSDVKIYRYSTQMCDVVIGVHPAEGNTFKLYFVPTCLIEYLNQSSISLGKIETLKENYEVLEHCKERQWVLDRCKEYGIL